MSKIFEKQALDCLMELIESPYLKKHYDCLAKLYRSQGFTHEADAFEYLVRQKFDVKATDNLLPNKK